MVMNSNAVTGRQLCLAVILHVLSTVSIGHVDVIYKLDDPLLFHSLSNLINHKQKYDHYLPQSTGSSQRKVTNLLHVSVSVDERRIAKRSSNGGYSTQEKARHWRPGSRQAQNEVLYHFMCGMVYCERHVAVNLFFTLIVL